MVYRHVQASWPMRIAFGLAVLALPVLAAIPGQPTPPALLIGGAFAAVGLGVVFTRLTIEVGRDQVRWWYGFGWPRFSRAIAEIESVETTQTTFWQGWGIRRTREGWLYNVGGYGAVRLRRRDGRHTLLGSDEPRRLKAAIERALPQRGRERRQR